MMPTYAKGKICFIVPTKRLISSQNIFKDLKETPGIIFAQMAKIFIYLDHIKAV
jgi:hypothetical protein